ncbi:MAG: MYG1 family protein [Lachnospiraceae bacterium]|nr:MYG1 family protein [Lachnospiraceae bacterium]
MVKFDFKKIIVHGGKFHADDVFCVAMAQILNPQIEVERVFKTEGLEDSKTIICDIGSGRYDHHQADAEIREDGHKFAACGLFFRDFGELLFSREESRKTFHDAYILPIEDCDNGLTPNPLSVAISAFNGSWETTPEEREKGFMDAVTFAKGILEREISDMESKQKAEALVNEALAKSNNGLVILSQYLPTDMFVGTGAKLVIFPSLRGGYQLLTVKKEVGSFEDVISLPKPWLEEKPSGCTFIHQARFIASFETEEQAIKAGLDALN